MSFEKFLERQMWESNEKVVLQAPVVTPTEPAPVVDEEPAHAEPDEQTPVADIDISGMSKKELDKYAAKFGIELDRRTSLRKMRDSFMEKLTKNKGN